MPQFTLNGVIHCRPGQSRLTYDQIGSILGGVQERGRERVTITWFNRRTKAGGTINPGDSLAINRDIVVTAVRTDRA